MEKDIIINMHPAIEAEHIKGRIKQVAPRGLDIDKAEELGVIGRISNLICAMHCLTTVANDIFGEVETWFDVCKANRHEIKRACNELHKAYDRWERYWREYQSVDGVKTMNSESAELREQFMRWAQLPVHWELGQKQNAPSKSEPLIEIDGGDRIWRLYREAAESDVTIDEDEEWAVMRAAKMEGKSKVICVERGMDKSAAKMSAKRMSANDKGRIFAACRFEKVTEKRLDVIPYNAYYNGEMIGDVKSVIL